MRRLAVLIPPITLLFLCAWLFHIHFLRSRSSSKNFDSSWCTENGVEPGLTCKSSISRGLSSSVVLLHHARVSDERNLHVTYNSDDLFTYDLPFYVVLGIGFMAPVAIFDIWTYNHVSGKEIMRLRIQELAFQLDGEKEFLRKYLIVYIHLCNHNRSYPIFSEKLNIFSPIWNNLFRSFYAAAGSVGTCLELASYLTSEKSVKDFIAEFSFVIFGVTDFDFLQLFDFFSLRKAQYFKDVAAGYYTCVALGIPTTFRVKEIENELGEFSQLKKIRALSWDVDTVADVQKFVPNRFLAKAMYFQIARDIIFHQSNIKTVESSRQSPRIVLLVRKAGGRLIRNLNNLIQQLLHISNNLLLLSFDDSCMSFQDQLREISMADIFITPHGAAMTYSFFLKPESFVIELFPSNFLKTIFKNIVKLVGPVKTKFLPCSNRISYAHISQHVPEGKKFCGDVELPLNWTVLGSKNYYRNQDINVDISALLFLTSRIKALKSLQQIELQRLAQSLLSNVIAVSMNRQIFHTSLSRLVLPARKGGTNVLPFDIEPRYLIYLPWEQLNNQIYGFISACAVAKTLSRVLVLPPVGYRRKKCRSKKIFSPTEFSWNSFESYFDYELLESKLPCQVIRFSTFLVWLRETAAHISFAFSSKRDPKNFTEALPNQSFESDLFTSLKNADRSTRNFFKSCSILVGHLHFHPINGSTNVNRQQLFQYYESVLKLPHAGVLEDIDLNNNVSAAEIFSRYHSPHAILSLGTMFNFYDFGEEARIPFPMTGYVDCLSSDLYATIRKGIVVRRELSSLAERWVSRMKVKMNAIHLRRGDYLQKCTDEKAYCKKHKITGVSFQSCWQDNNFLLKFLRKFHDTGSSCIWYLSTNDDAVEELEAFLHKFSVNVLSWNSFINLQSGRYYTFDSNGLLSDELSHDINLLSSLLSCTYSEAVMVNVIRRLPIDPNEAWNLFNALVNMLDPIHKSLLEQEICARSELFVGNFYSSFTRRIVEERQLRHDRKSCFF